MNKLTIIRDIGYRRQHYTENSILVVSYNRKIAVIGETSRQDSHNRNHQPLYQTVKMVILLKGPNVVCILNKIKYVYLIFFKNNTVGGSLSEISLNGPCQNAGNAGSFSEISSVCKGLLSEVCLTEMWLT